MSPLKPRVGELDRYPLQTVLRKRGHPAFKADVGVAEQDAHIAVLHSQGIAVCGGHQWATDFHAEMIPGWRAFSKPKDATASGAADVQMNRLIRETEQLTWLWQLQLQLEEAA